MEQLAIPAVYMRGGTSRALVFKAEDLPVDAAARDAILYAAMGSPDPNGRQLDGMGGGLSSLSKIAIVGPSTRADADVDYTFGQVAIDAPLVQYRGNCGNISAVIGPFAVDEGIVPASGSRARVRIHNTNTGKIIIAEFEVAGARAAVEGDYELEGVGGSGAPIRLAFQQPGGAATGRLLPTGQVRESLEVPGLGSCDVSLVDAANPVVFAAASLFGLAGTELPAELDAPALLEEFEALRAAAAVRMGLVAEPAAARTTLRNLPQVCLLTPPSDSRTLSGRIVPAAEINILVRMISAGQPHRATPLTGAMCLATAMRIPGTLPASLGRLPANSGDDLLIAHPSGRLRVAARVRGTLGGYEVEETVVYRTARRLMQGQVLVPRHRLAGAVGTAACPLAT